MSLATTAAVVGIAGTAYGAYSQSQMASAAGKDPFGHGMRRLAKDHLRQLIDHPDSIYKDESFKSALGLGLKGVERTMAAQGFLGSGNEATALMKYGMTFGLDWYKNQRDAFAQMAGSGMQPQYGAAVAGGASAMNGYDSAMSQLGLFIGGSGGAGVAGGGVGGTQAFGGSFGDNSFGGGDWSSFGSNLAIGTGS